MKEERTDIFGRLLPRAIKVLLAVEEVAFDIFNILISSFVRARFYLGRAVIIRSGVAL